MFRRFGVTVVALGMSVAGTFVMLPHDTAAAASSVAPASVTPGVGLLANRIGDLKAAQPAQYDVVVLTNGEYDQAAAIRAEDPNATILLYKNIASTVDYDVQDGNDVGPLPTGVGYADATAHHPGWFLKDTSGNPVQWADYPGHWWMDVGNRGYQDAWAAGVISDVKRYDAAGVMLDDVNANLGGHLPAGTTLAKYPDDAAYAAATKSFLTNVVPQLRAAGALAVANISMPWRPDWEPSYKQWVSLVDGVLMEFWMKPGSDDSYARFGENDWSYQMEQADDIIQAGKLFFPVTYGPVTDTVTQAYARASFLMAWNGGRSAEIWTPTGAGVNPWTSAWTTDVGVPDGPATELKSGVWERDYNDGLVLVNPSRTDTQTVQLTQPMQRRGGRIVTSLRLAPTTGAVLAIPGDQTGAVTATAKARTQPVSHFELSAQQPRAHAARRHHRRHRHHGRHHHQHHGAHGRHAERHGRGHRSVPH